MKNSGLVNSKSKRKTWSNMALLQDAHDATINLTTYAIDHSLQHAENDFANSWNLTNLTAGELLHIDNEKTHSLRENCVNTMTTSTTTTTNKHKTRLSLPKTFTSLCPSTAMYQSHFSKNTKILYQITN